MSATNDDGLLEQIIALARRYALRRWGCVPVYLKMTLPDGREQCEVVPAAPAGGAPAEPAPPEPGAYTRKQAAVLAALRGAGGGDVGEAELLRAADSDGARLRDLFRRHPAWNTLILPGAKPKTYRIDEEGDD